MSLILAGNQANVTTPLTANVSAIANNGSGAWRVTTSAPHLFGTNDYVQLQVTISAAAVTAYGFITVIDATHFDVAGTTYTATGTGTATDLSLTPQIKVPTDGDSFSLQLSGVLSALQGLMDRTQALRYMMIAREMTTVSVFGSGNVPIPPWATTVLVDGCGGGGGGGGGPGGITGTSDRQLCAGSGGAGSRRIQGLYPLAFATSIDVVLGAGGAGGAGSATGAPPSSATQGTDGGSTTLAYHDGPGAGLIFATLLGGAGGGGGLNTPFVGSASSPVFTPGGRGPAGLFRLGPAGLYTQLAPGYRQLQGIENVSGNLTVPAGGWPVGLYTDPVGQMDYHEGGASVANSLNATFAAAVSYAGAPSPDGILGGAAGAYGTPSGSWPGGGGGGGGGAGGFNVGGAGGAGGNGSSGSATNGVAGSSASANSGGGGGGGGGGGNGSSSGGAGQAGGNGGSGFVNLVFLSFQSHP